jgi:hypothetical protein
MAVKAAQQVYGIGEVTARVRTCGLEQRIQMRMACATFARHTGELRFGNADRFVADGPIDRHSLPLVCSFPGAP